MTKRQRFILSSFLLSLGFIAIAFIENQYRILGIGVLGLFTLIIYYWSLREGLGLNMTLITLVLPFFFTVGVGLFWFLLPVGFAVRVPIVILYGLGIYTLSLTSNIYTVAAIRTIALLRAARGVGFVLTLLTFFLIYDAIFSIRESIFITSPLIAVTSMPLFLQGYWSVGLEKRITKEVVNLSLVASLILGQVALLLHFWPVTVVVGSLFLTIACYIILGLGQAKIEGRLFKQTVREYLFLGMLVFIGMFFATRWGG
ncbi:hypothetical protein IPM62_02845 [Candidatus Woesebacteria bacterium]|nr:MAG: hypothetical protein IPM62_02845 [Candidatus Woesebacteria bacterium]